jgi:pimeloyl-ACP methyl ester carboxylesterase
MRGQWTTGYGLAGVLALLLSTGAGSAAVPAAVFVVDGAGNFQSASNQLRTLANQHRYPIEIFTYEWSHGNYRVVLDQTDYCHARRKGAELAAILDAHHQAHPEQPIYLIGHSAGTIIVLAALEHVSPNVVERAILLAPSVSAKYDLRPALASVKQDLHVFYSARDWWYLGVWMYALGTCDRHRSVAAGCIGFRDSPRGEEGDLSCKLVQHGWRFRDRKLGHNGGHFGTYQFGYLRTRIVPLVLPPPYSPPFMAGTSNPP